MWFQEEQDLVIESLTAHKSTLRVAFTIAAMKSWKIKTTNINSAFLLGKVLRQNIKQGLFLVPPKESGDENKMWKLNKAVYGLNDAA